MVVPSNEWTLAEAKRTAPFWLLNLIFTLTWLVVFMPMVHIVPFAVDLGIPRLGEAMTISVIGLAGSVGRLFIRTAWQSVWSRRNPGAVLRTASPWVSRIHDEFRSSNTVPSSSNLRSVIRRSHGIIPGDYWRLLWPGFGWCNRWVYLCCLWCACRFRTLIAGYLYTITGSYSLAFIFSAALNFVAFALLFLLKKPRR